MNGVQEHHETIPKELLLSKILSNPVYFTNLEFTDLVDPGNQLSFADLRSTTKELYSMNENSLVKESNANAGIMGLLNRLSTRQRSRKFHRKIKIGQRYSADKKVILAEGDSWFQFPIFVKDIIDHLKDDPNNLINSIAYGGDWITNIIYEGKYVEELSIHKPDVFLISGSGNDLVGGYRLAIMVDKDYGIARSIDTAAFNDSVFSTNDPDFSAARKYITKEFYSFVWIMKAQYYLILQSISKSHKLSEMQIITQGYANAIPSYGRRWSWRYPLKSFVNLLTGTGKWLKHPLMLKAVPDQDSSSDNIHRKILKTMIHEINEMFISLSNHFPKVYHVDSREAIANDDDWFDELHLKSHKFKLVAEGFQRCMDAYPGPISPGNTNPRVMIVQRR